MSDRCMGLFIRQRENAPWRGYTGLNIIKRVAVIQELSEKSYLIKIIFVWIIAPNRVILAHMPAVYKRPFSSFSRSLQYPAESSPRTLKFEAGRPSQSRNQPLRPYMVYETCGRSFEQHPLWTPKYLYHLSITLPRLLTPFYWPVRNQEERTKPCQSTRDILVRHYFHCKETSRTVLCVNWAATRFHVQLHGWNYTAETMQGRKTSCLEDSFACICINSFKRSQLLAEDTQI
jgi:hypothetical protein